ncbi:MAG: hypothetical protein ACXAEF_02705 [Candidatus Thorarchaeota archaeon]|jgi:tetratricopeptide (TPR) repeat protein
MKPKTAISKAEKIIENAIWESEEREDWEWELAEYRKATEILTGLKELTGDVELERKRVLAYCLMRIDETLVKLERTEGAVRRAQESLDLAIESGDTVQIARSKLAMGVRLLNEGKLPAAESHFGDIIKEGLDSENPELKQVVGWALLVRANILKGKSLYNQALIVAQDAAGILSGIQNYAGLAQVYSLISKLQHDIGNPDDAEKSLEMSKSFAAEAKKHRQ